MEFWGGIGCWLFVNFVWETRSILDMGKTLPSTIAIVLSSRRLESAINAGCGQGGCNLTAATELAAAMGSLSIFDEWKARGELTVECGLLHAAVRGNNPDIVAEVLDLYLEGGIRRETGKDEDAYSLAVESGSADMVESVAAGISRIDECVTSRGLKQAAEVGALPMMERLWDYGFGDQRGEEAVDGMSAAIRIAASNGHFDVAEWCVRTLHQSSDLPWRPVVEVMRHLGSWRPLVQWLHEEGAFDTWGDDFHLMAVRERNLEWAVWCLDNGWDYHDWMMGSAAMRGHLHVVRGLRERGYPWTTEICVLAARSGNVEMLKWCYLNGCPWSWPQVVEAGFSSCVIDKVGWAVRNWCIEVSEGEILVEGEWVPMVAYTG